MFSYYVLAAKTYTTKHIEFVKPLNKNKNIKKILGDRISSGHVIVIQI